MTLALISAVAVAGLFALWNADAVGDRFEDRFRRSPAFVPEWLGQGGKFLAVDWGRRDNVPYLIQKWHTLPVSSAPWITAVLGIVPQEFEIQTGEKSPVDVDGVSGWLWMLAADDLRRPIDPDVRRERSRATPEERRIYLWLQNERKSKPRSIEGPAIALQWNKNGAHYVFFAQHRGLMDLDTLLQMANSLKHNDNLAQRD